MHVLFNNYLLFLSGSTFFFEFILSSFKSIATLSKCVLSDYIYELSLLPMSRLHVITDYLEYCIN